MLIFLYKYILNVSVLYDISIRWELMSSLNCLPVTNIFSRMFAPSSFSFFALLFYFIFWLLNKMQQYRMQARLFPFSNVPYAFSFVCGRAFIAFI